MALRIRLQRFGRKKRPVYTVVVTDSRNSRDGRFIERLGHYDPQPNPSVIDFKTERLVHWYSVGARPSDAVKALLKAKKISLEDLVKAQASV